MTNKNNIKGFDKDLLIIITILFIIGELLIASTTRVFDGGSTRRVLIQFLTFAFGMIMMPATHLVDYQDFKKYYKLIYILGVAALFLVYVPGLGVIRGGARGWINIGNKIDIQPIEITKITFILSYGVYLEKVSGNLNELTDIFKALIMPLPIIALLMLQPDFGGAVIFMCITFGMLLVAGINLKIVRTVIIIFILLFPIIYVYGLDIFLEGYQADRIRDFFNFSGNGSDQVFQSIVAIVSGGLFGKGPFKGDQNRYGFLPVSDSDFIFAVGGEEYGIIGMIFIITLYFYFLYKLIDISRTAKDMYGSLIVIGIAAKFIYQFIQNIGMTIGLIPVTGIPLSFVSYGGSAMIMAMVEIFIVQNVAIKRKTLSF